MARSRRPRKGERAGSGDHRCPTAGAASLGLDGTELYDIEVPVARLAPRSLVSVKATKSDGKVIEFKTIALLNTHVEIEYYRNGGILHKVLRDLLN